MTTDLTPSPTVSFIWTCPRGHEVWPQFNRGDLTVDVGRGVAKGFCILCGETFPLTPHEQANLRKRLADGTI
jgi:hypothetical protein